jgi:hypothetical protein
LPKVPIRIREKLLFTAYLREITERKRHEAEREHLLAAEQAVRIEPEEANRAEDRFLVGDEASYCTGEIWSASGGYG